MAYSQFPKIIFSIGYLMASFKVNNSWNTGVFYINPTPITHVTMIRSTSSTVSVTKQTNTASQELQPITLHEKFT